MQKGSPPMASGPKHREISGIISYQIDGHPDFPDRNWGIERFHMTHHGDGHRVMRAYCELHDVALTRDVVATVDADFHPHDTFVRLTKDNKFYGSTWYRWTDTQAEYQGFNIERGRIGETVEIDRNIRGFGTHNLTGDAWLAARFDRSKGEGIQTFKNNLLSSIDHRGATGPDFQRTTTSSLQYSGVETVTVPAGTFECYKFAFVMTSNDHPPYEFWVTTDGDFLFVKGAVAAPYNWTFELEELNVIR